MEGKLPTEKSLKTGCAKQTLRDVVKLPRAQNYVYGEFEDTDTYIDSYEPSTGRVWALIPNSNGKKTNLVVYSSFKILWS